MADDDTAIRTLDEEDCWRLLASADVARIAIAVAGEAEVFPVNIVVDNGSVIFRSAEGTKLAATAVAGRMTVEVDGFDATTEEAWSVVMKGNAEVLESFPEIYAAEELPLYPWHPGPKGRWVRVLPVDLQGRRFRAVGRRPRM